MAKGQEDSTTTLLGLKDCKAGRWWGWWLRSRD